MGVEQRRLWGYLKICKFVLIKDTLHRSFYAKKQIKPAPFKDDDDHATLWNKDSLQKRLVQWFVRK